MYYENLKKAVQGIEDGLELKSDYACELESLDLIESDIPVLRYLGVPVWKCQDLKEKISNIRYWILEEIKSREIIPA